MLRRLAPLAALAAGASGGGSSSASLSDENFDAFIGGERVRLVEFYAPWCGHCKTLAPIFEEAAGALEPSHGQVLGQVDAMEHTGLAARYDVESFPTLVLFRNGQPHDFEGSTSSAESIVAAMEQQLDPAWRPLPELPQLSSANFSAFIAKRGAAPLLVEFYAPWCAHCKKLAPQLRAAAANASLLGAKIAVAKVDATAETQLAADYSVENFPTMFLFRRGHAVPFPQLQDPNEIVGRLVASAGPPAAELRQPPLNYLQHLEVSAGQTRPGNTRFVVGCFPGGVSDTSAWALFEAAAHRLAETFHLAYSVDATVLQECGCGGSEPELAVVTGKDFKAAAERIADVLPLAPLIEEMPSAEPRVSPVSRAAVDAAVSFVLENSVPLVGVLTETNGEALYARRPLLIAFTHIDYANSFERTLMQSLHRKVAAAAAEYPAVTFCLADPRVMEAMVIQLGLEDMDEVGVALIDSRQRKYRMEVGGEDFSTAMLSRFVEGFLGGKQPPFVRSEKLTKKKKKAKKKDKLVKLVGSVFDEVVLDPERDVLVALYAPWCALSRAFLPSLERFARSAVGIEGLVVAKLDATRNDAGTTPDFPHSDGYPAVYLAPAASGSSPAPAPIAYDVANQKLADFVRFYQTHGSFGVPAELLEAQLTEADKGQDAGQGQQPEPGPDESQEQEVDEDGKPIAAKFSGDSIESLLDQLEKNGGYQGMDRRELEQRIMEAKLESERRAHDDRAPVSEEERAPEAEHAAGERGDEERADGDEKKTKAKAKAKRPKKSSERKESAEGAQRQEGALWAQSDLNHDGGLDVHEWTGLFSRIQQGRQKGASEAEPTPATAGEIEARFKALDSNGDGRLTQVRPSR